MSRYRWTILALGTAAQWSYSAVFLGIPVLAPQLREEYGLSLTQVGVVLAAFSIGSVVTLLPWGLLSDMVGERGVLAAGLTAASAAIAAAAFTTEYLPLVLLLVLGGGAGASVNAASGRAVMSWFEPSQRGLALGIRQTALPLGGAAAALALPPIVAAGGTKAGLLVLAGACLVTALAGLVGLREAPPDVAAPLGDVTNPLRDARLWRVASGSGLIVVAQISVMATEATRSEVGPIWMRIPPGRPKVVPRTRAAAPRPPMPASTPPACCSSTSRRRISARRSTW